MPRNPHRRSTKKRFKFIDPPVPSGGIVNRQALPDPFGSSLERGAAEVARYLEIAHGNAIALAEFASRQEA